jgi:hypothetical protein
LKKSLTDRLTNLFAAAKAEWLRVFQPITGYDAA